MARRRRKRPSAKSEDKTQAMRTTASDADGLSDMASSRYFSEDGGKRRKLEQRQEEAADKSGEQERGDEETDPLHDDVTLLPSVIHPESEGHSLGQRSHPEEEEGEENESPILVTCDRNEGCLYLSKLRVVVNERCRTKCIRTGSTWWTPNEFQFVSGRGAAKDWKRTVKHNGHCLKTLLTNGTIRLNVFPPKCFCKSCGEQTEQGKASLSAENQKEQKQELAPSLSSTLESPDVADKKSPNRVKVESGGHEVKRSSLRTIKGHRHTKRNIKDIEDRKRRPSGLPVKKKKSRKSRPEPVWDGVLEERQGHVEGLLDLQEVRGPQRSLVFRLSSSSFEHVIKPPNDVSSRLNSVSAFEGQCNDHDVTESVPKEVKELPDDISEEHSVSNRPYDDVIDKEPSKTTTSSQETKEEACHDTEYDVGQPSSSSSSLASYQCNERASEAPEENVKESTSDDASTSTDKNSKGNVIGDGDDDVTECAVSDVTSLTSSSPKASVTGTTRRKSAYLSAVIEELKRRKRSREAEVIAPDDSKGEGRGGGGGMEGQKKTAASVVPSSLMISPMAESMKSEIDEKTNDDRTGVTCGPPLAESFDGLRDVMSSCLNPNPTGGGGLVHDHLESREKSSSGLRKPGPESDESKSGLPPASSRQAAWPATPSKIDGDKKQEVPPPSSSDRKFGIFRGKTEPRVTSSLETMTSPLNISHLASIYGLNASPLTSLPLPPLQFPCFPPYLFMGFPLHPLLPQFSSTSGTSLPVAVPPMTSSTSGSSQQQQQQKQRRMAQQSPFGASSKSASDQGPLAPDGFGALLRPRRPMSNYSSTDLHMIWRPLVTDFSSAEKWATGRPLAADKATGNTKPHSGTGRHPIWRPEMAPHTSRRYGQRSFDEKTIAQRPRAHAQKQAEMTSLVGASRRKSEFLVAANVARKLRCDEKEDEEAGGTGAKAGHSAPGAYTCDAQGVLDLSNK